MVISSCSIGIRRERVRERERERETERERERKGRRGFSLINKDAINTVSL